MKKWTYFQLKAPKDKCICDVLIKTDSEDLEEETAIFYKELGTFVMRASEEKPCGTRSQVIYWKEQ